MEMSDVYLVNYLYIIYNKKRKLNLFFISCKDILDKKI
ncbi:hypothetical protein IC3_03283 [Bacillus cereus VD142]|nr:hypothetical protein IC3_03283 [Bacillus cereus VD142]EJQ67260.1 hypothetical protein IG7_03896 [Bacillus cereus HuA2-4]